MELLNILNSIAPDILDVLKSTAGSAAWDRVKEYLVKNEKEPVLIFLNDIKKCLDDAANIAEIDLPIPERQEWQIEWIESIFKQNQKEYQAKQYLPNFPPVESLRDLIESDLKRLGHDKLKLYSFIVSFNKLLNKISDKQNLSSIFEKLGENNKLSYVYDHLDKTIKLREFSMSREDIELYDIYIRQYAVLSESKSWESFTQLEEKNRKDAEELINQYFFNKYYFKEYHDHKIVFVGADFGIGKSCLFRMCASRLASSFKDRFDGFIPVYFPLNECSDNPGRIDNYLEKSGLLKNSVPKLFLFLDGLDESGPVTDDNIKRMINHVENLLKILPSESRVAISSRLILGPSGYIANYIRNVLGGFYLRLLPFNNNQIEEYIKIYKNKYTNLDTLDLDVNKLKNIGLNKDEYSKPLYLWLITILFRKGFLSEDIKEVPLGRTGLYMSFINMVTRYSKIKDTSQNNMAINNESEQQSEINARYILQRIACIRYLFDHTEGISAEIISECLNQDDRIIFNQLGEREFLALSYFGHKGTLYEFTHQTFREYLAAEYIFSVLLNSTATGNILSNKHLLCIGSLTEETLLFVENILQGFIELSSSSNNMTMYYDFLKSCRVNCKPLESEIFNNGQLEIKDSFLRNFREASGKILKDGKLILLDKTKSNIEQKLNMNHPAVIMPNKIGDYNIYQERWICLIFFRILNNYFREGTFLNDDLNIKIEELVIDSKIVPNWAVKYLYNIKFENLNFDGIELEHANFNNNIFNGTTFDRAKLSYSNFQGANIQKSKLNNTILSHCIFSDAKITE